MVTEAEGNSSVNRVMVMLTNSSQGSESVLLDEWSEADGKVDNDTWFDHPNSHPGKQVRMVIDMYLTAALCLLGTVGNLVYVLVLLCGAKGRCEHSQKERGAHVGLLLLASSDLLFCVTLFPRGFIPLTKGYFEEVGFVSWYQCYSSAISSTLVLTSTWITVTLALLRYLGICHPFLSRRLVAPCSTHLLYAAVIVLAVVASVPMFLMYRLTSHQWPEGGMYYTLSFHWPDIEEPGGGYYMWPRLVLGTLLPSATIFFCNTSLVCALRKSRHMRTNSFYVHHAANAAQRRTSMILIAVAVAYIVLVFPAEVCGFVIDLLLRYNTVPSEAILLTRTISNFLQTINFAINFLFYAVINTRFRVYIRELRHGGGCSCCHLVYGRMLYRIISGRADSSQNSVSRTSRSSFHITRADSRL